MSIDMYLPALPTLAGTFRATGGAVQLTLSAFLAGYGLGQLVYGPLSDAWGRRGPMLAGIALYLGASLLCGAAWGVVPLILFRLLQGLSAGAGPLLARAMVRDLYERDRGASMLSLMTLVMGAAPLLAPLLGSELLAAFGWRSIFDTQAAFGVACLVGAWLGAPETLERSKRSSATAAATAARYRALLRDPAYLGYVLSSAAAYGGLFAYLAGSPFVFIRLYRLTPRQYGVLFALNIVGMLVCAVVNSRLVLRYGADRLLARGVAMVAAAGVLVAVAAVTGWGGAPGLVVPIVAFIASISFVGANALAGALARFRHVAGTASALAGTLQFGLGALSGTAVGAFDTGTALPMAAVMAAMGALSAATHRALIRPRGAPG